MGAVCGRPTKTKRDPSKPYVDLKTEENNTLPKETKELVSDPGTQPANTLDNDPMSPTRFASIMNKGGKDLFEKNEKRVTEETFKNSFTGQFAEKNMEIPQQESLQRITFKFGETLTNLDYSQKTQIKSMNNYPIDNPRSLTFAASNVPFQNYMSYANFDKSESVNRNLFEPMYKDKPRITEDYYLDMDEKALKKYYQFFNSLNQTKSKSLNGPMPSARSQSQLSEWSKVLQKHFSQEKSSTSLNDNKNKLNKVYKTILGFEERNWYEEMVMLYKEKQAMSKVNGNMTSLPFDRKLVQLQEQFKWLVSAIANTRLNPSNIVRVHDFPPYRLPSKKKGDKLDTSVFSIVRGHNSVTGSEDVSDVLSPLRPIHSLPGQSNLATQIGGLFNFDSPPDPRQNYYSDFPDIYSSAWQDGFIWKGVYLKLYSKTEAHQLKKELKVLKHMGVEYLQTETSIKINDPNQSGENQTWNVLLPIICTVESSSWVLLGTPMFSVRKSLLEDNLTRISSEASNVFKNTFLLSSVSSKNFKIYNKIDDGQTLMTMSTFGQSSYLANAQSNQTNSMFVLLSNVGKNVTALPKVNVMMIISQEINTNISFVEYPTRGLDPEIIKKALGYFDEKIGFDMLMETKKTKLDLTDRDNKQEQDLTFEVLQFKRKGWLMQMIHVTSKKDLPPTFAVNKRAMDLLSLSGTKKSIQIKGNVLVFACLPNTDTIVHPYFITEQTFSSAFEEERAVYRESSDPTSIKKYLQEKNKPEIYLNSALQIPSRNPSQIGGMSSVVAGRESITRGFSKTEKAVKDERILHEYFLTNVNKSLDSIVDHLDNTDAIYNFASLKELFHRKGVNMRFEWIVYAKLKRERAKVLVGADILARCIKMILNEQTSKRIKYFNKKQSAMGRMDPMAQKKKMEEIKQEKSHFLLEEFYKKALCQFVNVLIKDNSNTSEYEYNETLFQNLTTDLFLHRMRVLEVARRCLDPQHFEHFLSADITKTIINIPCLDANVFLDAISYHSSLCINYEVIRQVRNDKYVHWVSGQGLVVKPVDLNIIYSETYYLTTHERCYLLLLKFLPTMNMPNQNSIEFHLPSSLYKLRRGTDMHTSTYDCFLRDYYELPDLEILNDWVVLLESVMNGLYTSDGQQNLLVEAYIIQMVLAFFNEEDNDNQMTSSILERINTFANNSPVTSPELAIAIHTWYGILYESKLFVECEQSYSIALLVLHKLYGDPRGRGGSGTPWELFITWRLSILCRLQGKLHDAEYSEELFDAALISLKENPLNAHVKGHYIYNNPLKAFQHPVQGVKQQNEPLHMTTKPNLKGLQQGEHPFPYWVNNLAFDETCPKIDTLNSTLQKTPQLLKWMITYMPIFQPSGVLWDTAYLKDFFLSIMQSSFSNITLVSSVSNNSLERARDRSTVGLDLSTTKGMGRGSDKKENKFNPSGNMVQIFEKDGSTFNKREINGTIYSWGQNDKGQVGTPICGLEEFGLPRMKKMKIYYPKRIITLKDTIIQSVSCGHSHSMAITLDGQLLAWGDNRYSQLGLGPKAPPEVFIPTIVSNLKDVISVSCGHEHTVALTKTGLVYSWGEGEEGLLGHGDTRVQNIPKRVEALKNVEIQAVVCGGLHTLVLTKQGAVYAWGKGEGGQLGIPLDQLTRNPADGHVYSTLPKKIRGSLDGVVVVQIACGDAHSLALTQKGIVYAWGYTYQGQLGLGITRDTLDPSISCQIPEPTPIERLTNVKVTEVYAGATFSLFLSDKKELYGCGLNESNQLGIERNVKKVSSHLDQMGPMSAAKAMESAFPKKLDCFTSMPVLRAACGEAHSLALVLCDSSFMLFSWGMQKQGQLGIGDIQMPNSTPRPIPFLQYAMPYSMGCGAYHSLVVIGEPSKIFRKEALTERLEKKSENRWNSVFFEMKGSYESMIEMALNNLDNIIPNEEGQIDNPKAIRKAPSQV